MSRVQVDERLFRAPVITDTSLVKVLGEGCVQDMRRVVQNAEKLKSLAQMFAQVSAECILELSWSTLTQGSTQPNTTAVRLSNILPSAMSSPHGRGHR